MRRRLPIGFVTASLLLLYAVLPAGAAAPSPSAVNLTLRDMPIGFKQLRADTLSNSAVAHQTGQRLATLEQQGQLLTSYVEFQRAGGTLRRLVISQVTGYATSADARSGYLNAVASDAHAQSISLTAVGSARSAFSLSGRRARKPLTEDIIDFYRGLFVIRLVVAGDMNSFSTDDASHLAATIDARVIAAQ
ncbi:MAG TPA: hypothetical protein VHB98_16720 [Chloroflexota bacterium]|nr:hypothetical protein [Chloroflexota bacterium]